MATDSKEILNNLTPEEKKEIVAAIKSEEDKRIQSDIEAWANYNQKK